MSYTCCFIVTGTVPFKNLKNFIPFITLSTWIRKFATSFVFLTSNFFICLFNLAPGGTTNLQKWRSKSSWIWKPCLPLLHHLFLINHKTHVSGDKFVTCSTRITRRGEQNKPSGCNCNQKFKWVMVLVVWPCSSQSR